MASFGFGAFVCVAATSFGCEGGAAAVLAALREECALSSDCEDGLVCVFSKCHEACKVTSDCDPAPSGKTLRCMAAPSRVHYCQLEDETVCRYNSECPGEELCGRDGQCRDQCATDKDCVSDEVCVTHSCALASDLGGDGQLPLSPTSGSTAGASCDYDSECESIDPGFVCRAGSCNYECKGDVDCPTRACEVPEGQEGGRCAPSTVICVPGAQVACDCLGGTQGVQVCVADGTQYGSCADEGGPCGPP